MCVLNLNPVAMKQLLPLLLFATLLLAGCEFDESERVEPQPYVPVDPATTIHPVFPTQTGNQWTYETEIAITSPSTRSYEYVNTVLTIDGRVELPDGTRPIALVHEDIYADGSAFVNEVYVQNYRDGLYEIGHTEGEQRVIMKTAAHQDDSTHTDLKWNNRTYRSTAALRRALRGQLPTPAKTTNALFVYDQPQLILDYRPATGLWWATTTKTNFGEWSRKEIVGVETAPTPWGGEPCLKVRVDFDFDRDGNYDPNTVAYQYWNANGLLKIVYHTNIAVVDPVTGYEEPGTYREEILLTDRNF